MPKDHLRVWEDEEKPLELLRYNLAKQVFRVTVAPASISGTLSRLGLVPKVPSSRRGSRIFLTSGLEYVQNNNIIII
jgi:hypothetical protein